MPLPTVEVGTLAPGRYWHFSLSRRPSVSGSWLRLSDGFVGHYGYAINKGTRFEEAHGFRPACLPEEVLACSEHDRIDLQPQLVREVVLNQHMDELKTA